MNKLFFTNRPLMVSRIKSLIFVLNCSTKYNIDFIKSELIFCSRFKIYVLTVSTLVFAFKINGSTSQEGKFSTVKVFFHNQETYPQSWNFSTVTELFQTLNFSTLKEFFYSQRTLPQSRNFSTTKELFHSQGTFL